MSASAIDGGGGGGFGGPTFTTTANAVLNKKLLKKQVEVLRSNIVAREDMLTMHQRSKEMADKAKKVKNEQKLKAELDLLHKKRGIGRKAK
jgi:uncharacterized protein YjaG (DUF416 family)